jgi:hypothetical protein
MLSTLGISLLGSETCRVAMIYGVDSSLLFYVVPAYELLLDPRHPLMQEKFNDDVMYVTGSENCVNPSSLRELLQPTWWYPYDAETIWRLQDVCLSKQAFFGEDDIGYNVLLSHLLKKDHRDVLLETAFSLSAIGLLPELVRLVVEKLLAVIKQRAIGGGMDVPSAMVPSAW